MCSTNYLQDLVAKLGQDLESRMLTEFLGSLKTRPKYMLLFVLGCEGASPRK